MRYMRIFLLFVSIALPLLLNSAEPEALARKAARAFESEEWASAQALYGLVTDDSPTDVDAHARLITAALMRGDSTSVPGAVERALAAGVPLRALFENLRADLRSASGYGLYADALERIAKDKPYLRRPISDCLLDYYLERRDGTKIERCALYLLAGLPDSPKYLESLGWGLLYQGKTEEAESAWRKALKSDACNTGVMIALATLLGDTPEAVELLHRADSICPSPAIKSRLSKHSK